MLCKQIFMPLFACFGIIIWWIHFVHCLKPFFLSSLLHISIWKRVGANCVDLVWQNVGEKRAPFLGTTVLPSHIPTLKWHCCRRHRRILNPGPLHNLYRAFFLFGFRYVSLFGIKSISMFSMIGEMTIFFLFDSRLNSYFSLKECPSSPANMRNTRSECDWARDRKIEKQSSFESFWVIFQVFFLSSPSHFTSEFVSFILTRK